MHPATKKAIQRIAKAMAQSQIDKAERPEEGCHFYMVFTPLTADAKKVYEKSRAYWHRKAMGNLASDLTKEEMEFVDNLLKRKNMALTVKK